jgi:adenine-specific DNA-methyltransferase
MTTVFIGGSRGVSRLSPLIRARLDRIVAKGLPVLVGDANGADKAVQRYLQRKEYDNVEVFCSGATARNNLGSWKLRKILADGPSGTVAFYTAKDRAMTDEASVGFMLWDGKSIGTLLNVHRLIKQHKKAVLYISPLRQFRELRVDGDWKSFFSQCDPGLRKRVSERSMLEAENDPRLLTRIKRARASLRAGRGVRLEDIEAE